LTFLLFLHSDGKERGQVYFLKKENYDYSYIGNNFFFHSKKKKKKKKKNIYTVALNKYQNIEECSIQLKNVNANRKYYL